MLRECTNNASEAKPQAVLEVRPDCGTTLPGAQLRLPSTVHEINPIMAAQLPCCAASGQTIVGAM